MDWREIKKIDGHVHILPEEVHLANPDEVNEFSYAKLKDHLKIMDKYNIKKSIIMPFNDPFLMSMGFNVESVHENLINMCDSSTNRYYAFADLDIRNSEDATLKSIKDIWGNKNIKGIKIHPNNTRMNIDDKYNDNIFELARELDIPIAIHSYPSRKSDKNDFSSPKRIANLINRHPKVKVIISHMGGFQWKDLLELDNFIDISASLPDLVSKYGIENTNTILRKFGVEKLIFGTDWPCSRSLKVKDIYSNYFDILNQMDFNKEEAEKIAYNNISELLNL